MVERSKKMDRDQCGAVAWAIMIPNLNEFGVIPPGIHECTFDEIVERFTNNEHRRALFVGFLIYAEKYIDVFFQQGLVTAVLFGGSFITDKEKPKDIDVLLELTQAFGEHVVKQPETMDAFDQKVTGLKLQVKPWHPNAPKHLDLLPSFMKPREADRVARGMGDTDLKGILRCGL